MRAKIMMSALALLVLTSTAAVAQPAPGQPAASALPACPVEEVSNAKPIPTPPTGGRNAEFRGVVERSLSQEEFARFNRTITCTRGAPIVAGGLTFTVTGLSGEDHPRRVVGANPGDPGFYVTGDLDPDALMGALLAGLQGGNRTINISIRYVLVRVDSAGRQILGIYNGVPDEAELRRMVIANAAAPASPVATVNTRGGDLRILGGAAPAASARAPVTGPSQMTSADGKIFTRAQSNGVTHALTGITCDRDVSGVRRQGMTVYDPSEGGRDVSCHYGRANSPIWFTVYFTRFPGMSSDDVFEAYKREGFAAAPPAREIAPPLAPGVSPLPTRAAFWQDQGGLNQGFWFATVGDWHLKVRTSFRNGREAEAAAFAQTMFATMFRTIRPTGGGPAQVSSIAP